VCSWAAAAERLLLVSRRCYWCAAHARSHAAAAAPPPRQAGRRVPARVPAAAWRGSDCRLAVRCLQLHMGTSKRVARAVWRLHALQMSPQICSWHPTSQYIDAGCRKIATPVVTCADPPDVKQIWGQQIHWSSPCWRRVDVQLHAAGGSCEPRPAAAPQCCTAEKAGQGAAQRQIDAVRRRPAAQPMSDLPACSAVCSYANAIRDLPDRLSGCGPMAACRHCSSTNCLISCCQVSDTWVYVIMRTLQVNCMAGSQD
jgi:hypothetical protein